jgi:hypothetical protein
LLGVCTFVKPIGFANILNDLLRLGDCLAFGLGALGLGRSLGGGTFSCARRFAPMGEGYRPKHRSGQPSKERPRRGLGAGRGLSIADEVAINYYSRFKRRLVQTGNSQIEFEAAEGSVPSRLILAARRCDWGRVPD